MIMTLKKRKRQKKTPTETSVQLNAFLNSNATWMKIPWNSECFKNVDSMRATYVSAAMHHGVIDKISVNVFGDSILLMRKDKDREKNLSTELDSVLRDCKSGIMKVVAR